MQTPFVLCTIRQNVSISPCHIGNVRLGIEKEMNSKLMRYSDELRGVILCFRNIQLEHSYGNIMNESPYIHCKILAEALVYQPVKGMRIHGVVNKIGSNHIGLLFAGIFNGSVAASELPPGFVHNYSKDAWYVYYDKLHLHHHIYN